MDFYMDNGWKHNIQNVFKTKVGQRNSEYEHYKLTYEINMIKY